jgi:phosphoribosylformylglycinamidine synthase
VYWQFVGAIKGMSKACIALNTPVTGGNVSFYNQSSYEGPVFPSPVIGMIGIIENAEKSMSLDFKQDGDLIYLIGASKNDVGSSQYAYTYLNVKYSSCPHFEMEEELLVHKAVKAAIKNQHIESAHDVSDGGLFVSLFESALAGGFGFEIETDSAIRKDAFLFGEAQSRVVVSVDEHEQSALEKTLNRTGVPYSKIGRVTKSKDIVMDGEKIGNVTKLRDTYMFSLNKVLD